MGLPFMPLYVADYLGDTMHLSLEQHGAYLKLLMCLWRSGGKLPNDRLKIARMLGVTPAKWDRISADVMGFFETDGAEFWNLRVLQELGENSSSADSRRRSKPSKTLNSVSHISEPESQSEGLFQDSPPLSPSAMTVRQAAEAIWKDTPTICRTRSSKGQLERALQAAVNRRKNLAVIVQAVAAYFADPEKAKDDHKYARGVHRVVQDDYWETWAPVQHAGSDAFQLKVYRVWMQDWLEKPHQWRVQDRGPTPSEPGCRIPLSIMQEFGYQPPAVGGGAAE